MALIVAYVLIDVVLQVLPPHYSVVSDAESDLAVGPFGWVMGLNFAARGTMSALLVAALWRAGETSIRRRIGLVLLLVAGVCSVGLVFFPTDVNGAGQFGMSQHTPIGMAHLAFATTGFLSVLAGMSLLTATRAQAVLLVVALLGLGSLALSLLFLPQVVGLAERLCLAGILGWAFVTAYRVSGGSASRRYH
jgi:hypothetical membrane protein